MQAGLYTNHIDVRAYSKCLGSSHITKQNFKRVTLLLACTALLCGVCRKVRFQYLGAISSQLYTAGFSKDDAVVNRAYDNSDNPYARHYDRLE